MIRFDSASENPDSHISSVLHCERKHNYSKHLLHWRFSLARLYFIILLFDNTVNVSITVYIYRNLYPMPFASVQEAYFNKRLR